MQSPLPDTAALEAGLILDDEPAFTSTLHDHVRSLLRTSKGVEDLKRMVVTEQCIVDDLVFGESGLDVDKQATRPMYRNESAPQPQQSSTTKPPVPVRWDTNDSIPSLNLGQRPGRYCHQRQPGIAARRGRLRSLSIRARMAICMGSALLVAIILALCTLDSQISPDVH